MDWIDHIRKFLTYDDKNALIAAHDASINPAISTFLKDIIEGEGRSTNPQAGFTLIEQLKSGNHLTDAAVVELLILHPFASIADFPERFPLEHKKELILKSFGACSRIIDIAKKLHFPEVAAKYIGHLGKGFFKLCQWATSQELIEEELMLWRKLADKEPHMYRFYIATALTNLGNVRREQKAFSEARAAIVEARDIFKDLVNNDPYMCFYIAINLDNLGAVLAEQRVYSEAQVAFEEALEIWREMADKEPHTYLSEVAMTLSNLGNVIYDQRAFSKARTIFEEARDIYKELANKEPHIYLAKVAKVLCNLGNVMREQRAFPEARTAFEEALAIRWKLVEKEPYIYIPDVAGTLNNLGNTIYEQGALSESRIIYEDALEIWRKLADKEPHIYLLNFAMTLNNLGNVMYEQRAFSEARIAYEKAMIIWRKLAEEEPDIYLPNVATTLGNLDSVLAKQGAFSESQIMCEEALEIWQKFADKEPHVYLSDVASTLNRLGILLEDQGRMKEALRAFKDAIELVEDTRIPNTQRYLMKGKVWYSYNTVISHLAAEGDTDNLFRHLVAVREPKQKPGPGAINNAIEALKNAENRLDKKISILIVQPVADNLIMGIISGNTNGSFQMEFTFTFYEKALQLVTQYREWLIAWSELIKANIVGNNEDKENAIQKMKTAISHICQTAFDTWDALPSWIKDELHPDNENEVFISAIEPWAMFPFEILKFSGGEKEYLGLHRPLPRIEGLSENYLNTLKRQIVGADCKSSLIVADPQHNLPSAFQEGKRINDLLEGKGYSTTLLGNPSHREATDVDVVAELFKPLSIFHYAGHGTIIGEEDALLGAKWWQQIGEEVLCLKNMPFGASALRERRFQTRPLVVLDSCMTGRMRLFGGMREDLAGTFLRIGAEAVVASGFPVCDELGCIFGEELYKYASGDLQDAFMYARKKIEISACDDLALFWPSWALLTLYGNPYARLPHVDNLLD